MDRSYKPGHIWWSPSKYVDPTQLIFNIAHIDITVPWVLMAVYVAKKSRRAKVWIPWIPHITQISFGHVCHNVNPGLINPVYVCD